MSSVNHKSHVHNENEIALLKRHFDERFYLTEYPYVGQLDLSPILHFHLVGWKEGKNPSRTFNTQYYLQRYSDVAVAGVDPLLHYAMAGETEGRSTSRRLDSWRQRLDRLSDHNIQDYRVREGTRLEAKDLRKTFREKLSGQVVALSISHDDYAENTGGVQNMMFDEQVLSGEIGWHYLHVSPILHRMRLAQDCPPHVFDVSLRLDYDHIGIASFDSLIELITYLSDIGIRVEVIVHHLMAHSPSLITALIRASKSSRPIVWAHDFFTICPSYTLLRNDVVFCGGPAPLSPSCSICHYGHERIDHLSRIRSFFEENRPVLMAPSQTALDNWLGASDFPISEAVPMPLARLIFGVSDHRRAQGTEQNPLRVAHIGSRAFHKGWPAFENLALKLREDGRYQFYQFGRTEGYPGPGCIEHISIAVTRTSRHAMIEAIAKYNIDVVIIWSFWPETFCFTAYEALAGGAFIITHKNAGNVPKMLYGEASAHGIVLENETELLALFSKDCLIKMIANSKRSRAAVVPDGNSIRWLYQKSLKSITGVAGEITADERVR